MAISTCTKCGNHNFELVEASPNGSNFKYNFVQCARCGSVVGALDFWNIGSLLEKLAQKLQVKIT